MTTVANSTINRIPKLLSQRVNIPFTNGKATVNIQSTFGYSNVIIVSVSGCEAFSTTTFITGPTGQGNDEWSVSLPIVSSYSGTLPVLFNYYVV